MPKARILVVEDSRTQAKEVTSLLQKNDYEAVWVEDGKSAIKASATEPFDVILLDLVLPDISGTEVSRWLKSNEKTRAIPIIMVTVKSDVKDKVMGFEAGADDYVSKPYNEIELNARIYAALRTKALQDELRAKNRQLEELLERVHSMAITDPLTGLYNRRYFQELLKKEFSRVHRYSIPLSILMLDIDHFKKINDKFGHQAGDSVLKEFASIITSSIRRDIDIVARWGGEEFIILLPQTTIDGAKETALRLLSKIDSFRFSALPPTKNVTTSIGVVSTLSEGVDSIEKLIKLADNALYKAKELGRNRVETCQ